MTDVIIVEPNIAEVIEVAEQGPAGPPGSVWRNGNGPPSDSLGINGDYYLDDVNGFVYAKASGVYTHVATLGGGGGFISSQRAVSSGTTSTVLLADGNILILFNSAAAADKTLTIPDSTGSLQVVMVIDFYANSDVYPINIQTESALFLADIATPKNSITLLDSILGWILQ